jgi:hypothetical protein
MRIDRAGFWKLKLRVFRPPEFQLMPKISRPGFGAKLDKNRIGYCVPRPLPTFASGALPVMHGLCFGGNFFLDRR